MVTREMVRDWLLAYLNREIAPDVLVEWARQVKLSAAVLDADAQAVGPVLARIGITGKGGYSLTYEDAFDLLEALGFAVQVTAEPMDMGEESEDES